MKKVFLFTFSLLATGIAFAQKPVWGLKAGMNFNNIKSTVSGASKNLDSRIGYHIGVISHNHITHQIAIQPELQFSSQGTGANQSGANYNFKLDYLNLPVMFQYMFDNGFRAEAGPYVGMLLSANLVDENGGTDNLKEDYKSIDAGLGLGLNYLTYSGLGFGGRYNLGLANILDPNQRTGKNYNRVFQLSLFYMFDHDHKRKSR